MSFKAITLQPAAHNLTSQMSDKVQENAIPTHVAGKIQRVAVTGSTPTAGLNETMAGGRQQQARTSKHRVWSAHTTLLAHGAPFVWLTGGALATALAMIIGLLVLIAYQGLQTFWPLPLVQFEVSDNISLGSDILLGEISRCESFKPEPSFLDDLQQRAPVLFARAQAEMNAHSGLLRRQLIWTGRTSAVDFAGSRAVWVNEFSIQSKSYPEQATVVERFDGGRSYGTLTDLLVDGKSIASGADEVWRKYNALHGDVVGRGRQITALDRYDRGAIDRLERATRLALIGAQLNLQDQRRDHPNDSAAIEHSSASVAAKQAAYDNVESQAASDKAIIAQKIKVLQAENNRYVIRIVTADDQALELPLAAIVRAYPANRLSLFGKLGIYASRWWEFLSADPRESNTEGGVFPAIWGTVAMTLIMSMLVVPFGVLAALYLREYAKAGAIVNAIRISINNLAGVPSIVFGVFGLGLFCYVIGATIDQVFFRAALSEGTPTYGTGGIMWASLTLALLTLPVVIVATEEALSAVPNSMREGSYACGASKWQTIRRIVLPRAMPGILTGMILAMARGAGEVAPLLLVGVKDLSASLPVDGVFPFVHPERSFMHLAYQIYIVGFKSPNSELAKPMVFTTTLLLIGMVALLSISAVYLRSKLRKRFMLTQF
ncbi:MAG TPA: phosphate ABC transporter permease PstA [Pirellulales bacterium]|jgi:phosphate transport system permease protein|nr:phosphate ABC transporter permease PstA [Pirellulales bacterium]